MDTTFIPALVVLIASAVLLLVVSASEAAVGAISRTRVQSAGANGLSDLLQSYVRRRQRILRALNTAGSVAIIAMTISLVLIASGLSEPGTRAEVIAGMAALFLVAGLRQTGRTLALVDPEMTGLRLAAPILALQWLLGPVAWALAAPSRVLIRALGRNPDEHEADTAGDLLAVLERTTAEGEEEALTEERRMMRGILAMSEQTVREVLSPRPDVTAVPADATVDEAMRVITETGFSRIPVYQESLDHIIGVLYAKDLLRYLRVGEQAPSVASIARAPYFVPESKRTDELLADLRRDKVHLAIVVDEYGGTAGVVTVEDLVEEIVGEIADEYDPVEVDVLRISADEAIVDAGLPIDDLSELFGTAIEGEDFDTVGGLVLARLGRIAAPGDEVTTEDERLALRVLSVLGRRIKRVRVRRTEPAEADTAE